MLDGLFIRLVHANPRRLFQYSLVCLAGACAWWIATEFFIRHGPVVSQYGGSNRSAPGSIDILAFLDAQNAAAGSKYPSPFVSEAAAAQQPSYTNVQSAPPVQPQHVQTTQASGKRGISLVYLGMMIRTDGKTLAMIENRTANNSAFYSEGDTIGGFTVGKIDQHKVHILRDNGSPVALESGIAREFEGSANDN